MVFPARDRREFGVLGETGYPAFSSWVSKPTTTSHLGGPVRNFTIRLIINALALTGAAYFVTGIEMTGGYLDVLFVALVFGLVNALVKPIVFFFSLPFLFFTLGLFYLVINGAMLLLTARLTQNFSVEGIWPAVIGSLVISIISMLLSVILKDDKKK